MKKTMILAALSFALCCGALEFDGVFQSHMVLQQGRTLAVSGRAAPGERLTLDFAGQKVSGRAGEDGRWRLELSPLAASGTPRSMILTGEKESLKLDDVLVGEVWLCSGQSNMHWPLARSLNGRETAAESDFPRIRIGAGQDISLQLRDPHPAHRGLRRGDAAEKFQGQMAGTGPEKRGRSFGRHLLLRQKTA